MNWIKIADKTFYLKECDIQLSFESWAIMYLKLDIEKYPEYYDDFISLYEAKRIFEIYTIKFTSNKSYIKTIDIDFNKSISMSIRCENLDIHNTSDRRDGLIDDILNNKTTFVIKSI